MKRRVVAAAVAVLLAAGTFLVLPEPAYAGPHGVVQVKKQKRSWGIVKRSLCVGADPEHCTWVKLRNGNIGRREYKRCDVGETWPACRKP